MNIWNEINLKKPPLNTVTNQKLSQGDLRNLKTILEDAIVFYDNQSEFDQSAALCSRLIARRKNSFKKMHGFKSFTKLNSALCRLLKVDIKSNIKNFLGIMPEYISSNNTKNEVPTKPNFEYLLLKLIALHKLYERISFCAQETAKYFTKLLYNNFFFDTLTLFLTTISNLFTISNQIGIFTTSLYTKITIYRKNFPLSINSANEEFIFPKKLFFSIAINNNQNQELDGNTRNTKIEFEENTKNIQMVLNDDEKQICTETIKDQYISSFSDIEKVVNKNSKNNFNINEIKTAEDIQRFIKGENKARTIHLKKCLTKKISENHWKKSIKDILNKINLNDNKNAIKTFKYLIKNKL